MSGPQGEKPFQFRISTGLLLICGVAVGFEFLRLLIAPREGETFSLTVLVVAAGAFVGFGMISVGHALAGRWGAVITGIAAALFWLSCYTWIGDFGIEHYAPNWGLYLFFVVCATGVFVWSLWSRPETGPAETETHDQLLKVKRQIRTKDEAKRIE